MTNDEPKFYDAKAERALAGAMADKERAEAANTMVRAQLNRVAVDKARAELADEQARRATQRQAEQRQFKRATRAERWASVRAAARAFAERVRSFVPLLIGGLAMGSPILIGWNGQLITAREVLHLDALAGRLARPVRSRPRCDPARTAVGSRGFAVSPVVLMGDSSPSTERLFHCPT